MIIASFLFFLILFVVIGAASTLKSDKSHEDYLLAGRKVSPILVGLSAMATNNSGYMFIGAIGYTYSSGLESIWVMFAWMAGDFLASFFIHKKMRTVSEQRKSLSFGSLVATWDGHNFKWVRRLAGIITVFFLGAYAAAQFTAGSKALQVVFEWDLRVGSIIGSVIVLIYCLAGGIRASIWTDAAQTIVMFLAMILMLVVGVNEVGGFAVAVDKISALPESYLRLFPEKVTGLLAIGLFILGYVMGGVGIVAQPHIMIRFMSLDDSKNMSRARTYYYSFYLSFCLITFSVGLLARLIFPESAVLMKDGELALPMMTMTLLPDILIGLVLAGIFAASMSTADSQILSCSAAVTNDIAPERLSSVFATKIATVTVTLIALGISLLGSKSVFRLVLDAWSVLAAAFAPLIIVYALGEKLTEFKAMAIMIGSVAVAITWNKMGLGAIIYDSAPALTFGVVLHFAVLKHIPSKSGPTEESS